MADTAAGVRAPSAPWADDPLAYLLAPHAGDDFMARLYEREPLIIKRDDAKRYTPLLSIEAIDRLIAGVDLHEGQIDLANANRTVQRTEYISSSGFIDRGVIARQFQSGSTIILQQLHQMDSTLSEFCRALEHVFSCHVQTNIYLTPPNAQGFKTHYDNHDVFVLQISGAKAWRLYNVSVDTPYRGEAFNSSVHKVGDLREEFVLEAGDCAYVPRGMMHDASTAGEGPSLHITVGFIVRTWAELMLEAVSEVAVKNIGFRRSLPPGYTHRDFDRKAAAEEFRRLARAIGDEANLDASLDLMIDNFIRSRVPDTSGAVVDAARAVKPKDRFQARAFTPWRLADDGDVLVLIAPGGDIDFKPEDRDTLERALTGGPFKLSDLPGADEDMIRKLQAFGLVARI